MNKRLLKRHKRQVARAKERVKLSEPDVRTPEQLKAAREQSQPAGGWGSGASAQFSAPASRHPSTPASHSPGKADA